MGIKEQVYLFSPVFMQNLLTTLYGYRLQRERYGPAYQKRFQELADKCGKANRCGTGSIDTSQYVFAVLPAT